MAQGRRDNKTGAIYKDGDGYRAVVQIGVDPQTGKPLFRKVRTKTHDEAVAALSQLQHDFRNGKLGPAQRDNVESYLNDWLESKIKLRAPSTYRLYSWIVKDHIIPHLGKKRLDAVTRPDVQNLITSKVGQRVQPRFKPAKPNVETSQPVKRRANAAKEKPPKVAPTKTLSLSTLRNIRSVLHAAYESAIKDGITARNPAEYIDLPREPKRQPVFLNPIQAASLMKAAKTCETPELIAFLLGTGARIGEATGMRWQDVDLTARHARICGCLQRIDGKLVRRATTKTNQDRLLPIGKDLAEALVALKTRQMVDGTTDPDGLIFLNAYGRRLDNKYVAKILKGVCRTAKVPEVSPHKLRHTVATLALAETGDIHAVQKLLGHQQSALTTDLYGHFTAETLRPVSEALERAMRTIN